MDGIGERLKEERLRNGWSQKDLAQESKTNVDTISGIETGQHEPRPSTLRKLAKALNIEVRDLFEEPALSGKAEAPTGGAVPNSLDDLLKRRGFRTRHLADENLKRTLDELPLEAAIQIVHEVNAEMEAIDADLASLRGQHAQNNKVIRLWNDAVQRFLIARYSLRAKRGQEFVPVELKTKLDQTMQDHDEVGAALVGVG